MNQLLATHFRTRLRRRTLPLLLCSAALALAGLLPAGAAAAPDPVLVAINRALAKQQATAVQARAWRATWTASARAARTAPTSTRRSNIAAVRSFTTNLARAGGLVPGRLEPALLSVKATTQVLGGSGDFPGHEEELTIPGEPVVFTYYSGRGVQFQPFETYKEGLRKLNRVVPDVAAARAIADRMAQLGMRRGDAVTWEYFFPFGGPARPWTSSISQALAVEFHDRVSTSVPAGEGTAYAEMAAAATRAFLLPPTAGGVAVRQNGGRFYLMYPFATWQRILNGHLQVLINVNRYAKSSGNPVAAQVVRQGVAGVLPLLPKFDTGGWSNYQPGQEADLGYHEFQTEQLVKLGDEMANPTFADYGARFTTYLETPPVIGVPATSWPSIIPAKDGFRDNIVVRYTTDKRAKLTMVLFDLDGREVRRISTSSGRGSNAITWDGRNASGSTVPDGEYRAELTATDVAGNRSFGELSSFLAVTRDTEAPLLALVSARAAGAKASIVTVRASDAGSGWVDVRVVVAGATVASRRGPRAGTTTLRVPRALAQVRTGELVLRDSTGNETREPITAS